MFYSAKALLMAAAFLLLGTAWSHTSAQTDTSDAIVRVQQTNIAEQQLAREIIEETVRLSRLPDIYSDFRRTVRDVYIPVLKEATQWGYPGVPAPDANTAATMAKALTFLTYVDKAGQELDGVLSEQRANIITDAAAIMSKHTSAKELDDLKQLLAQPAAHKVFEIFYATTQLATGFTYDETRTLAEYQALIESWVDGLNLDPSQLIPGLPGNAPPPSARKVEKAQAMFADLVKISRVEEMVTDVKRFARDVYAELAPKTPEEKQELKEQIDQMEFAYAFQKTVVLAAAPSILATALTDEQLATLHTFVRTPVFAKIFNMLSDVVRKSASFTTEDIRSAQSLLKDVEKRTEEGARSKEEQDRINNDWKEFAQRWQLVLESKLSSETREGLQSSYSSLQADFQH